MELSKEQLNKIKAYFLKKPIKSIYIFGSYARGDADTYSDIDIMIEVDFYSMEQLNLTIVKKELEILLSNKVDVFLAHKIAKYAKKNIWKERKAILSL